MRRRSPSARIREPGSLIPTTRSNTSRCRCENRFAATLRTETEPDEYAARPMTSLTVLMPVFNELETVETAIERTLGATMPVDRRELVIVDDGSTDGTAEILAREWPAEVRVVTHPQNMGKGAAIQTGLQHATGEFTTVMDADLEYDPDEVADLVVPLSRGDTDAVYGVRGFQAHNAFSFWYVVGNRGVTF